MFWCNAEGLEKLTLKTEVRMRRWDAPWVKSSHGMDVTHLSGTWNNVNPMYPSFLSTHRPQFRIRWFSTKFVFCLLHRIICLSGRWNALPHQTYGIYKGMCVVSNSSKCLYWSLILIPLNMLLSKVVCCILASFFSWVLLLFCDHLLHHAYLSR